MRSAAFVMFAFVLAGCGETVQEVVVWDCGEGQVAAPAEPGYYTRPPDAPAGLGWLERIEFQADLLHPDARMVMLVVPDNEQTRELATSTGGRVLYQFLVTGGVLLDIAAEFIVQFATAPGVTYASLGAEGSYGTCN
jgi:hypothetical protein